VRTRLYAVGTSPPHEILCRGHDLLSLGNEIIKWRIRDTLSWLRVTKSWERDN
jgi:hypothetical protein